MTKYLKFNIILIKHLKNVEEIFFNTKKFQMTKMLFHYLNAGCQNLKALHWMPDWLENINYQNQDLINVMQRVHFLEIGLTQLTEFQFDPNNLTQLTLNHYDDYKIEKIKITFPNVTKLNIYSFHDEEYDSISEYKFPKLEFAKVIERNDEERMMIKEPFVHQIKYIKTLEYKTEFEVWIPFFISQLSQLTNLVWKQEIKRYNSIAEFFECLDVFSEHQLLENIKIEIQDEHWLIHKDFYEKLICFYKTKPNTKIVIRVSKVKKYVEQEDDEDKNEDEDEDGEGENDDDDDEDEDDEDEDDEDEDDEDEDDKDEDEDKMNQDEEVNDLDEYIKLFKETKDMHKLNMKLFII